MSPRMGRTGGAAARGFGKGTAVRGPRGIPSVVSATAVGTVENASNGKLNLTWTNADATAQTRIYNGGTLLATENAGTTTKSFTDLIANTAYTLTVKHFKDSIESAGANFSQAITYTYNGSINYGPAYTAGDRFYRSVTITNNGNNGTTNNYTDFYFAGNASVPFDSSTPGSYTYTVPSGVTYVSFYGHGAGGADGTNDAYAGMGGAIIGWAVACSEGQVFNIVIAAVGTDTNTTVRRSNAAVVTLQPGQTGGSYSGGFAGYQGYLGRNPYDAYGYLSGLGGCYQGWSYGGGVEKIYGEQGGCGYNGDSCATDAHNYYGGTLSDYQQIRTGCCGLYGGSSNSSGRITILENPPWYATDDDPYYDE